MDRRVRPKADECDRSPLLPLFKDPLTGVRRNQLKDLTLFCNIKNNYFLTTIINVNINLNLLG